MNLKSPKTKFILTVFSLLVFFVIPNTVESLTQKNEVVVNFDTVFYYTVKLVNNNTELLKRHGQNIHQRFVFSSATEFQNIYTFQSKIPIVELKNVLGQSAVYLDYDLAVQTETITVTMLPNDPGFTTNGFNIDKQWGLVKANFIDAWDKTTGDTKVVVAVIDTGIDSTHEDLARARFIEGFNILTGKKIPQFTNSDDNGHGTLVAGVVGAVANNSLGIVGAGRNVTLMPIKGLNSRGSGTASQISEGIVWASDRGAHIINMSLGGIGFAHDTTLAKAITYAFEKDIVIISAAGNDVAITGGNLDIEPVFPICNDNGKNMIIGVTATDVNDLKPDFANYGKACIDVTAPGKRILSTINHDPATGVYAPDSYAYASGTSLAVPFVSGQAALLKSLFPYASNRQIRDRIIATADSVDSANLIQCSRASCKGFLGSGRINVAKSLNQAILSISDGDVVQVIGTTNLFYINGSKRQPISPFVRNQRFYDVTPKQVFFSEIDRFSEGSFAEPLNKSLIKTSNSPTVYIMEKGVRQPILYSIFLMHSFDFKNIITLSNTEVDSWVLGSLYAPPDGTLVRTGGNPTVYWVVGGTLHAINNKFFVEKGLNIFPVIFFSDNDIKMLPKGEDYIL